MSINETLIDYMPDCNTDCKIADWSYKEYFTWAGTIIFMVTPLVINLIGYSLIIRRLNRDKKRRSRNNLIILIRAILICVIFTLSWVPSVIISDILKMDQEINLWILGKFFFYINCLSDPILYTFSNNVISGCLDRFIVQVTPVKPYVETTGSSSITLNTFKIKPAKPRVGTSNRVGSLPKIEDVTIL